METIFNKYFSVSAKAQGAELTSIKSLTTGIEYLWQADPAIWSRHAPVLFPIVGKMEGKYTIEENEYELSQHGFARDFDFELFEKTDHTLTYKLIFSQATLTKYPYKFELYVAYQLEGNQLITTYTIVNVDEKEIWFSVGAHPAFNCPLVEGEQFSDYYLEFEKPEITDKYLLNGGLLSGKASSILENTNLLPLSTELFKDDALVLKHIKSEFITLKSKKSTHSVKMGFKSFPFFGIWTKPGTDKFVCLEPWMGIADTKGKNAGLKEKEGIICLEIGKKYTCHFNLWFE